MYKSSQNEINSDTIKTVIEQRLRLQSNISGDQFGFHDKKVNHKSYSRR